VGNNDEESAGVHMGEGKGREYYMMRLDGNMVLQLARGTTQLQN
jgi:hypothetical protein